MNGENFNQISMKWGLTWNTWRGPKHSLRGSEMAVKPMQITVPELQAQANSECFTEACFKSLKKSSSVAYLLLLGEKPFTSRPRPEVISLNPFKSPVPPCMRNLRPMPVQLSAMAAALVYPGELRTRRFFRYLTIYP